MILMGLPGCISAVEKAQYATQSSPLELCMWEITAHNIAGKDFSLIMIRSEAKAEIARRSLNCEPYTEHVVALREQQIAAS